MVRHGEDGSAGVQIVGLAAFVTALIMVLAAIGPGIGATVAAGVERQVCEVSGGADCGDGGAPDEDAPVVAAADELRPVAAPGPPTVGGCTAGAAADLCIAAERLLTSSTPTVYLDPSLAGEARAASERALQYFTDETVLSFVRVTAPEGADLVLRGADDVTASSGLGPIPAFGTTSCRGGVPGNVCGQKAITLDRGTDPALLDSLVRQELGHAVGLGTSQDPNSPMYDGAGRRWTTALLPGEIAAIDSAHTAGRRTGPAVPGGPGGRLNGRRRDAQRYSTGMDEDPLERLRALCLALPETTERISHGEPTWFVRGRTSFATYADHHHDDRLGFWCAAPDGAQAALVAADPERFFVPPYVGHRGWLGVRLDVPVDWDELRDIVADAYRRVAPRALVARLDGT